MQTSRKTSLLSFEGFGVSKPFDPSFRYVTSPIFSPTTLGALRLLFAVYALTTAIITFVFVSVVSHDANEYLPYFTNLSYIGLVAYFWASSVQTIAFVLRGRKSYPLQTWPRFLQLFHVFLHATVMVFPIIVSAVFWSLLASSATFDTPYDTWSNVSRHALNTAFAVFEILCTHGLPSPWSHLILLVLVLACYLGVAYITHATQGYYTYSFLDPATEHAMVAAYVLGIAVGCCLVFGVVRGVCVLRRRASFHYGRFEGHVTTEDFEEWQDMTAPKTSGLSGA